MSEPEVAALIVEDEVLTAILLETALGEAGFAVTVTSTGAEAMTALESEAVFQVLVTDIRLGAPPDGWAVATRARELHPEIQVIYITGDSMDDWRAKGVPDSVLLSKPFLAAQIVTAATTLLNRPEAQTI